jgi:ribokinase
MRDSRKKEFDCLGFGVCPLDYLSLLKFYPRIDEKIEAKEVSIQGGGPVPTAMVTLAKLGAKVCFVGKAGGDGEGQKVLKNLKKEGVNTDYLIVDKKSTTAKAFIWIDEKTGKRTVVLDQTKIRPTKKSELLFLDKVKIRFLHLDFREPEINIFLAKWAKKQKAKVILDMGSQRGDVEKIFPLVDYLVVSKRFAYSYTRSDDLFEALNILIKKGFKCVVITAGEEGSVCATPDRIFHKPAFKVKVKDTTGAGDVFHGAFIFGLLKNWDLEKIIEFSNACAALKCTQLGGRAGIPTLIEVKRFLKCPAFGGTKGKSKGLVEKAIS